MSGSLSDKEMHEYMEQIAASGCADVNQLIIDFDNGAELAEIAHLDLPQQRQVMSELRKVMKVYDNCEIDTK